eukprot:CAMPEP_0174265370 /NCGR_PEP_ID=MMETSP0439-20130205/26235_1 /TAXON_ID=0 /ORGANISM="Stereomyxa ramosa, Strain Chinc5" /LENGTH=543 /DNA_ID=CAMNT_0015351797 /DNA_START=52 /DNA_END=1683 /DNA_ORIENTATION=+
MEAKDTYVDLGTCHTEVSVQSAEAALWMDRAFLQCFGFDHEEAIRLFYKVLEIEDCPMAHWGIAWCNGVNYNNEGGMDLQLAYDEVQKARALKSSASPVEQALIDALCARYVSPPDSVPLKELSERFAKEMEGVYNKFDDVLVASVYIESLMNLRPWKLWDLDENGNVPQQTYLIKDTLEKHLKTHPDHPGLCHLYVHLMELSGSPEEALPVADRLRNGVTPEQGHLLHMASHIDMWLGRYKESVDINIAAWEADQKLNKITGQDANFHTMYMAHNGLFVVWSSMFIGQYKLGLQYAKELDDLLTIECLKRVPFNLGFVFGECYKCAVWHVWIRYGKWQEILDAPVPEEKEELPTVIATAHYAKAIALGVLGRVDEADKEKELFFEALENPNLEGRMMHNNPQLTKDGGILRIAAEMAQGEIEYRRGNYEEAFGFLRKAVELDSSLAYDEPWGWMVPTRHALGALLLEQNCVDEATEVYLKDLEMNKENMWALQGLLGCYTKAGKQEEADKVAARLKKVTSYIDSDFDFYASCMCATKGESCC